MNWNNLLSSERLRQSQRSEDARNEFDSDYGRILFSPAMRRMHDKTQVFPLTTDDNIHSRLTHSMEVMAIGYSLGLGILKNKDFVKSTGINPSELERIVPIILQCACLVHDIGNPPFGHFGETVIKDFFKSLFEEDENTGPNRFKLSTLEKEDFTLFDGNAQGFRILTKLQVLNDTYGLNLTFATLAAYNKYPNYGKTDGSILTKKKRGVFQSERKYFEKVSSSCGMIIDSEYIRHPFAFLMEAADSICYLVMDLEDGFNKKWYRYADIKNFFEKTDNLEEFFLDLHTKYPGNKLEVTRMVKFRIEVIRRLVSLALRNFQENIKEIYAGTYQKELILDCEFGLAKKLKEFCDEHILPNREILSLEVTGYSVLSGLLKFYVDFLFHDEGKYRKKAERMLSNSIVRAALLENGVDTFEQLSDYYKLRVVVDYISGMTDQFALDQFQKLSGQKII